MGVAYPHCFLYCPNLHSIPVPHPNLVETDGNPRQTARDSPTVNVVCPDCGVVSAYSMQDVTGGFFIDRPSLFQANECHLVAAEVECDGENCRAPKVIHAILGDDQGTWRPKAVQTSWHFSDTARCGAGHQLRLEKPDKQLLWTNLHTLHW
jgi:hypothetical protein